MLITYPESEDRNIKEFDIIFNNIKIRVRKIITTKLIEYEYEFSAEEEFSDDLKEFIIDCIDKDIKINCKI